MRGKFVEGNFFPILIGLECFGIKKGSISAAFIVSSFNWQDVQPR